MFTPLAFPDGAMFYELMTHLPPPSHLALSPFDLYREPLALLAVADGSEMDNVVFSKRQSGGRTNQEANIRTLYQELEGLRDRYPRVLVHQVLIFDYSPVKENPIPIPEGIVTIPPEKQLKRTTIKTVMCDVSSLVLAEMTTLAKSFEGMTFIDSPGHSSGIRQLGGTFGEDVKGLSRRNSQFALPTGSRAASTGGLDRSHARMSMPPVPFRGSPFGSSSSTPARPSTPVNGRSGLSNPPTTLEDVAGRNSDSNPASPERISASRPDIVDNFRTQSQDRVSVQGFGPGSPDDRFRVKGKSRIQIVLGSLYLQAGRWSDALKELCEGAAVAKSGNDHIWHGKALELSLVCLLLLGWAGLEFQVPNIMLPPPEKGNALSKAMDDAEARHPKQKKWLRSLQVYMPELVERIIGLYSRISAENLPPLPLSEAIIRFSRMLTAIHVAHGELGPEALEMMVMGVAPSKPLTTSPRFTILPTRTQIVSLLFRAFPASASELLTTIDRIVILSGIASVLGVLGFQRKKAMVVRELVSVLIGGLVEARTRGAADVGIHPAAGLVALNGMNGQRKGAGALELGEGDIEHGIDAFLGLLLKTYGVVDEDSADLQKSGLDDSSTEDRDSDAAILERIQRQSGQRLLGMKGVKLNVLRACINFSEALPDFAGVLRFSSDLLRTAGSGIAPGPKREDAYPSISREEQARLIANISKTSSLSKRLGVGSLTAEYWDEFLVRGIKLEPLPATRTPVPHAKSALSKAKTETAATARASQDVNPFIYNPFLKQPDAAAVEKVLVAGETASFRITLQNPYEIEVEVESVRLDTEGADFESAQGSTVIGPYRTQIIRISGMPKAAGSLKVKGAVIKVRGCRERRFPIFPDPWAPENEIKIKTIGVAALMNKEAGPSPLVRQPRPPRTEQIEFNVIAQQPVVVVKSCTAPQSSVMILEGERQSFSVTLQNLSTMTPVDFLLFSFKDSTQEPLQMALDSRDATSAELYEYELILAKKQALRLKKGANEKRFIAPGGEATFEFEILGKPGLTSGLVQVDYAHLGGAKKGEEGGNDEVAMIAGDKFFTRQVSLALTITVNASIEISRMDILPLHGSIPEPLWARTTRDHDHGQEGKDKEKALTADTHCLLVLDLRNAWPSSMLVELESGAEDGDNNSIIKVEEQILPGNTNRVILPLPRIYVEDPHAFIPALNPKRQRQFVVSTRISPEVERANREAFWYRERILSSLRGRWREAGRHGSGAARSGDIELRTMRLTSRMIEAVKVDDVGIEILSVAKSTTAGGEMDTTNNSNNTAYVDEFFNLRVRLTNRTAKPIYPLLRLIPALSHRSLNSNAAADFTRKFAWNGTLQRVLPLLPGGGESTEVDMGVVALCRGEFEFTASVEETRIWVPPPPSEDSSKEEAKQGGGSGGRPRSDTETMADASVLGKQERRVWHSRAPCRVVVRDR